MLFRPFDTMLTTTTTAMTIIAALACGRAQDRWGSASAARPLLQRTGASLFSIVDCRSQMSVY